MLDLMTIKQPTPAQIKRLRELAGLTQGAAAELVHASSWRTWINWETDPASREARPMPLASWELFLRKLEERGPKDPAAAAAGELLRPSSRR